MSGSIAAGGQDDLKASVRLLKKKPINCALGDVGKLATIRLDPTKKPMALLAELRKDEPKVTKPVCGLAFVPEEAPAEIRLDMQAKPASGICKRLAVRLKGTGLRKVVLLVKGEQVESHAAEDDQSGDGNGDGEAAPDAAAATKARIKAAADAIGGLHAGDPRGAPARALLTGIVAGFKAGAPSVPADLARLEALVATAPKAAMQAAGPNPAQVLKAAVTNAYNDVKAARFLPGGDIAALNRTVAQMVAAANSGAFDDALRLSKEVRGEAVRLVGSARDLEEQRAAYDRFAPVLGQVEKSYFTEVSVAKLEKLHPGNNFQALIDAQKAFRAAPNVAGCDGIAAAAEAYLQHFETGLKGFQRATAEHRAKKSNAEAAKAGARHMKLALQLKQFGPPPWDAPTAERVAGLRAAFAFETNARVDMEKLLDRTQKDKGPPIPAVADVIKGENNVSAAFWVKGYDPGKARAPKDAASASDTLLVFKPADGEESVDGFPARGGAPREAITHALGQAVRGMTGLDLGCPETHLASISGASVDAAGYNAQLKPEDYDKPRLDVGKAEFTGSIQQFAASVGSVQKPKEPVDLAALPAEECHKVALLDILSLNLDRHKGNVLLTKTEAGDGAATFGLAPIDHGLTLPNLDSLLYRAPERMNNTSGNALLCMPGSFTLLPEETLQRLDLLQPERLAAGIQETRRMLAEQHPALGIEEKVPDESLGLVKRSAKLLKLAARVLSPAVIQILIAAESKALFQAPSEEAFEEAAQRLIGEYAEQADAIQQLYLAPGVTLEEVCARLRKLGWVSYNEKFARADMPRFRAWMARNAKAALDAFRNGTHPPAGHVVPN